MIQGVSCRRHLCMLGMTAAAKDHQPAPLCSPCHAPQDNPLQALPGTQQGFPILGLDVW